MGHESQNLKTTIAQYLLSLIIIVLSMFVLRYFTDRASQKDKAYFVDTFIEEALITTCYTLDTIPEHSALAEKIVNNALSEKRTLLGVPDSEKNLGQLKYRQLPSIEGYDVIGFTYEPTQETPDWFRVAMQDRVSRYRAVNTQQIFQTGDTCGRVISREQKRQCTGMLC